MALAPVTLDDKYTLRSGRIYLTGPQALTRLVLTQRWRDAAAGLNTAGFVSGYRGSPLGGLDLQLGKARDHLRDNRIHFQPGLNEDLAATAVWGTQQTALYGDRRQDGVFAMWYGKGPGVDRSGDALRHANMAGTAPRGGVLALAGDDHTAKSSSLAHQTEFAFADAMIPVLSPAGVQELLDLGLAGFALSRYSGLWVASKMLAETVDSSASVHADPDRLHFVVPRDFEMPPGGVHIRWPDPPLEQEERLHRVKLPAALAFARANRLDRPVIDGPDRRLGIVAAGKSYLDVRQALDDLGLDEATAREIGLSVYKAGMPWPLEPEGLKAFARGLDELIVVEEKRPLMEDQIKAILFSERERPHVVGKTDEAGRAMLPTHGELAASGIARVLAERIRPFHDTDGIRERLAFLDAKARRMQTWAPPLERPPWYCSGCPHNTSTVVPEGSRALAGIGCHYMVMWMDRNTETFTHMGAEGVPWIGQAPFSEGTQHVFVNLGDGTYYHSGSLAIRACVAANVNMTFKILYNDAVAMTGGQPVDGPLDVPAITRQVHAEGVRRIEVVTDEPDKYPRDTDWAPGVRISHRDHLDRIQRELREIPGVTVLLYDQACAAEKRRRRKRGSCPDPARRVVINEDVCEGCGDCGIQSNCVSIVPVETEFGTKRAIDQSSCNKDFSCLKGFCPSFVTVRGGRLRRPEPASGESAGVTEMLPRPALPELDQPYGMVITGVGGTGVVTIGALLGMAAHIEGKGCSVLDMTGLAQKGGAVVSHVRLARNPEAIHAAHLSTGSADLLLGADLVVAAGRHTLDAVREGRTRAVVNSHETPTGDFTYDPDYTFPDAALRRTVADAVGEDRVEFLDATRLATGLLGDAIATNMFLLGHVWQQGLVPLSDDALMRAVELNGVAVERNRQAFLWGRRAAHNRAAAERAAARSGSGTEPEPLSRTLDELIERRVAELTDYQDSAYAERYRRLVERVRAAESALPEARSGLAEAAARSWYKLLACKDEYEVARLYSRPGFRDKLERHFEGDFKVSLNMAPPILAGRDPATGHPRKREFGPWIFRLLPLLARMRRLRGTWLDLFGYTAERRRERALVAEYERLIDEILDGLTIDNHDTAVELAGLYERVRGFGHVKQRSIEQVRQRREELLRVFHIPGAPRPSGRQHRVPDFWHS